MQELLGLEDFQTLKMRCLLPIHELPTVGMLITGECFVCMTGE